MTATAAKSLQSCPTLCDPMDGSPPASPVPGIIQARTLEWVAISFSNAWKWRVKVKSLSHFWLLETPWTAAYQALHPWDFPGKSTRVGCHCLLHNSVKLQTNQTENRSIDQQSQYFSRKANKTKHEQEILQPFWISLRICNSDIISM